ncbi:MAG: hypothetical protein RIB60_04590 [Phycisphaerales bacterium]
MTIAWRFIVLILTAVTATAPAQPSLDGMLASAESAMDDAERAMEADPELAPELYAQAAARYERIITEHGIDSVELHRAAGNARLLAGQTGLAIASYLRAERLDPTDEKTAASLAYARSRVGTTITPGLRSRTESAVFWWRGRVPRHALFLGAVIAFGAAWGIEIALALGARRVGHVSALLLAVIALTLFGSLVAERAFDRAVERAVIVGGPSDARTGPSDVVYPRSFEQQLLPGVELVVLSHQDGWVRVRLADGRETWVRDTSIARV